MTSGTRDRTPATDIQSPEMLEVELVGLFMRELLAATTPDGVLEATVALAAVHLSGAAAVTVLGPDGVLDTFSSSALARAAERAQRDHGQSPGLDACADQPPHTDLAAEGVAVDLRAERGDGSDIGSGAERRWPAFTPDARRLGVTGVVVCGLGAAHGRRAVLNVYATAPAMLRQGVVRRVSLLAEHAAMAWRLAEQQAEQLVSLRAALASRQQIGEATGILMERHHLAGHDAFGLLADASQRTNVKLRLVAEHVVLTGQDPSEITARDLPGRAGRHTPAEPGRGGGDPAGPAADGRPAVEWLRTTVTAQDGCRVVLVTGQVDLATSTELDAALRRAHTQGIPLIVDLTQVEFFDAAGLRVLMTAHERAQAAGTPLRIVPSAPVTRVIGLAAPHTLALYPDRHDALTDTPAVP